MLTGVSGGVYLTAAQTVTPATNGTEIPADNFASGTWRTLTGPVIQETAPGQLTSGNIRLNAPSGFVWDTGGTAPAVTVTQPKSNQITVTFEPGLSSSSQMVFSVTGNSGGQPPNNPHTLTFSNLRIRPAQGTLESGQIRNVGSASPGGTTNYGTISMVAGADNRIRVEDAPNSGGSVTGSSEVEAGSSITVYSNVRDQFNNFKRNEASSWAMQNITGGIVQGDIAPAGDNKSAVFTGTLVGTGNIRASSGGLTTVQSGLVTVNPTRPDEMVIQIEPGSPATAGQPFSAQPKVAVLDQFGNIVDNNFIEISAERFSGEGTLQGDKAVTVSNGIAEFDDLSHNIADTISIRFSASGLSSVTSQDIIINHASANSLVFLDDVPNGSPDTPLSPPFDIQIIDDFGNHVAEDNISVNLNVESQDGDYETITVSTIGGGDDTDNNGVVSFDSFQLDEAGSYSIKAVSSGNNLESPESNLFTIASAGELAGFQVEITGGGNIGNQTAGQEFNISIYAVDGNGDLLDGNGVTEFTGNVNLTTTGIFSADTDTLDIGPFNGGVYDPHPVTLTRSGEVRIRAANADTNESQSGSSNLFTLEPASANPDSSFLDSETATLIADGTSETEITLQLVDEFGNQLTGDISETVEIFLVTNGDSLLSTTANGDGTYTATLTASDDVGTEEIGASIDGNLITSGNLFIDYTFDELDSFLVEASGGGSIEDQTAGESFSIQITALDEYGNVVESFDGNTIEITSSQTLSSGGGIIAGFTNGIISGHSITVTSAGSTTMTVRNSISSETGSSNEFTVEPAAADPATSLITPNRSFLKNDGTDNTLIIIQLKDAFHNNLVSGSDNVTLSTTGGSLSGVTDNNDGTYTATLTAGEFFATATLTGTVNSSTISDEAEVFITEFNRWTGNAGGQPANASDWSNTGNWSLGSLPTTNQITLIPAEDINGDPLARFPILSDDNNSVVNPVLDFLVIELGANITLSDRTLTVNQEISGGGSFFGNNGVVNILGSVDLSHFIAGSSDIFFNGSSPQSVDGDFTGDNLFIENDVTVNGFFEAFSSVNISPEKILKLDPGSQLVAIGDVNIDGQLTGNESDFTISGDINGSDISLTGTRLTLNGDSPQFINGIHSIKSFIINNPTAITIENDLEISDTLNITQGHLTVNSGLNLATNVTTGLTSNIRMLREIEDLESGPGWRLLATPLQATYQNFLSETITQGFENSSLGFTDSEGDSLQPNVLYYDETFAGTDNQRWRAPADAENSMNTGRGYFVYFFGDIAGDDRYNQAFPDTLDVDGAENTGNGSEVILPVTYTAEADTGFNIVGNPYAATVDWDDGTWEKTNMSNAIYVWDENTNQYLTWNGISGSLGDGKIAPFQGFWVKANGNGAPGLRVRKTSKTTGGIFRKTSSKEEAEDEWPVLELNANGAGMNHSTFFTFTEEGRNNIDDLDAYRLLPFDTQSYLEIFTLLQDGTELAIHSLPRKFGKPIELPVHISGVKNGGFVNENITLSWPQLEHIPDAWTLTLTDTRNGNKINLKTDHFYDFSLDSRAKTPPALNTPQNFNLLARSKAKAQSARFLITIDPGDDAGEIPDDAVLDQNYPNPFNPATAIRFGVPLEGNVRIDVYDVIGRRVQTLTDQRYEAGFHQVEFDGRSLASGVYFYRLVTGDKILNKRMTLVK
ncbi:MAG: invasin domain 3-containing protein [Balneolaceae bacterium]